GLMVRLLLDASLELPSEARTELESRSKGDVNTRRTPIYAYSAFLVIIPAALVMGVRSVPLFAVGVTLALGSLATAVWASRRHIDRFVSLLLFSVSTLFIASLNAFMGPFIMVPAMLGANAVAFVARGERRDRPWVIGVSLLALVL